MLIWNIRQRLAPLMCQTPHIEPFHADRSEGTCDSHGSMTLALASQIHQPSHCLKMSGTSKGSAADPIPKASSSCWSQGKARAPPAAGERAAGRPPSGRSSRRTAWRPSPATGACGSSWRRSAAPWPTQRLRWMQPTTSLRHRCLLTCTLTRTSLLKRQGSNLKAPLSRPLPRRNFMSQLVGHSSLPHTGDNTDVHEGLLQVKEALAQRASKVKEQQELLPVFKAAALEGPPTDYQPRSKSPSAPPKPAASQSPQRAPQAKSPTSPPSGALEISQKAPQAESPPPPHKPAAMESPQLEIRDIPLPGAAATEFPQRAPRPSFGPPTPPASPPPRLESPQRAPRPSFGPPTPLPPSERPPVIRFETPQASSPSP